MLKRINRWNQIAIAAAKQSRRAFFPEISNIQNFNEALEISDADLKLIFSTQTPDSYKLKDALQQNLDATTVDIFIGPEGGLSEDEISSAYSSGAIKVSLGDNILRTETAAIVALTIVLYEKDALYSSDQ